MSAPTSLFEKIWRAHVVREAAGDVAIIAVDRLLLHERTGGIALKSLRARGLPVAAPRQVFCTMDHVVDTLPGRTDRTLMPTGTAFITETRDQARAAGLTLFDLDDPRQGIVHVISPEQGLALPGTTLVCPDSHTCTQGALGALAWGIGSSEAEHVLATGVLRVSKPRSLRISIDGRLSAGVTAKDLALHILARRSSAGARGMVVEYGGETLRALDMEARLTLCNMSTELGAFGAVVAPDETTFAYLEGRPYAPAGELWDQALRHWCTLRSDDGASFDAEWGEDACAVAPMVTWGSSPQQGVAIDAAVPSYDQVAAWETRETYDRALDYMALSPGTRLDALPIDAAFIGSCTNARIEDLRRAAGLLVGRKIAAGVRAICVPGSTLVKRQAEAEGLDRIFLDAGFEWRESGCSMCFFAGGESFAPRQRVITSTNRNFEGRQGVGVRSHLASPETVAASAVAGRIADPRSLIA